MNTKDNLAYRNKITLISFIMAIAVMIRHSVNYSVYRSVQTVKWIVLPQLYIESLVSFVVPFFFMLSGFLYFQNYTKDKVLSKLKSRFVTIVIPYMLWNVIAYLCYYVLSILPVISAHINTAIEPLNVENIVRNALFGNHNITWYLRNLIMYILGGVILYYIMDNRFGFLVPVAVLIIGCVLKNDIINYSLSKNPLLVA